MAMNPKESDDRALSREVLLRIPAYLDRPTVIGIGEIGMNRITRNEIDTYTDQVELARAHHQMILIHTPHLEDKLKGTRISIDVLNGFSTLERTRVMVDHAEEHTLRLILDNGYWAGLTLYPNTKVSAARAVDMIERFGPERICVAGACDWGPSDAIAVPRFIMEMRRRRHPEELIHRVVYENPVEFLSQSPKFRIRPTREREVATAR
jgi:predicted metal-dependent TIM-barrel fold hydrolase